MEQDVNIVMEEPNGKLPIKKLKRIKPKRAKAKIFGHRIEEVMREKDICSKELADLIDSDASHIHRILNNKRPSISLPIAMKIAKVLETPIEELFFLTKPTKVRKVTNK